MTVIRVALSVDDPILFRFRLHRMTVYTLSVESSREALHIV